jgi:hypothetical protein
MGQEIWGSDNGRRGWAKGDYSRMKIKEGGPRHAPWPACVHVNLVGPVDLDHVDFFVRRRDEVVVRIFVRVRDIKR